MTDPEIYTPKTKPRRRHIPVRGIDYAISEWGQEDAPLLVYLHGFADCGATFQFVVDEMIRDWRIVAPDWRGFGETRVDDETFWFPDYLADLDRLLEHYSPGEPVRLIGHSMGGNVAGLYAGVMPDRVRAFVNMEGFGLRDTDPNDAPERYREWLLKGRETLAATERDGYDTLSRAIRSRNPSMSPAQAGFVARCWAAQTSDGSVRLRVQPAHKLPNPVLYRRAEAEACWRQVTAPVLLVAGRRSEFGSPDDLPFPDSRTAWIEDSGHMLHFEQPAALARVIEEFLCKPVT